MNKLFFSNQYGFFNNQYTSDAILKLTYPCHFAFNLQIYRDFWFPCFFFSKAFNTVDHVNLCHKLNFLRKKGFILDGNKSYPADRLQCGNVGESHSDAAVITRGLRLAILCYPSVLLNLQPLGVLSETELGVATEKIYHYIVNLRSNVCKHNKI